MLADEVIKNTPSLTNQVTAFPTPYPDECLGGLLLRYHRMYGGLCVRDTLRDNFKLNTGALSGIPTAAIYFAELLRTIWPNGIETIISDHTIWPVYRPFLDDNKAQSVLRRVRDGGGDSLQFALGDSRCGIPIHRRIRTCRECIREDRSEYGEFYLHVQHQIPGVAVCWRHGFPLAEWVQKDFARIPSLIESHNSERLSARRSYHEHQFAELAANLWEAKLSATEQRLVRLAYIDRLNALGFFTDGSYVRHSRVIDMMNDRIGQSVCTRLAASDTNIRRWIHGIIHRNKTHHHPIKHLLLIGTIFGSVNNYIEALAQTELPFPHAKQSASRQDIGELIRNRITQPYKSISALAADVGVSTTTCITYAARYGVVVKRRPKRISSKIIESVKKMARTGADVSAICQKSSVSQATAYRIMRTDLAVEQARRLARAARLQAFHRSRWIRIFAAHPTARPSELKEKAYANFAWLYRHDKTWLKQHTHNRLN